MSIYEPSEVESDASRSATFPRDRDLSVADTGSGLLVFADCPDRPGRELVAFAGVTDWDAIRGAVQKRGLDIGATHQLPALTVDDVPRTLPEDA